MAPTLDDRYPPIFRNGFLRVGSSQPNGQLQSQETWIVVIRTHSRSKYPPRGARWFSAPDPSRKLATVNFFSHWQRLPRYADADESVNQRRQMSQLIKENWFREYHKSIGWYNADDDDIFRGRRAARYTPEPDITVADAQAPSSKLAQETSEASPIATNFEGFETVYRLFSNAKEATEGFQVSSPSCFSTTGQDQLT